MNPNLLLAILGGLALLLMLLAVFSRRTARRIEAFLPPGGGFVEDVTAGFIEGVVAARLPLAS